MDKKGFTLVELLAVIVILSVILVIAVPKITDTINNTKMSSLETSVKLIAKRAESYIEEQAMLGNTVPDTFDCGVVSQVNNTDYPTCSIKRIGTKALVNVTGGGKFLGKYIYNGTKDVVEVQNTELTTLATNVIANSGNVNIDETGDKNIRYSGTDPSNYVYFNCSDYSSQNDTNCEKWRIIGIFNIDNGEGVIEQRVKIIGPSLGDYSWDTTPVGVNGGYGYNIWETKTTTTPKSTQDSSTKADVNRLLNEVYLEGSNSVLCYDDINNHPKGCPSALRNSPTTKEYISNAVWNLGGTSWKIVNNLNYLPTLDTYNKERGSLTGNGFSNIAKTTWTGMVGLPCMSDFSYASTNVECRNDGRAGVENSSWKCTKTLGNWMHESSYSYWSLSPNSGGKYSVFDVANNGKTNYDAAYIPLGVRPTVYLNSSVKITANDGSSATPYKLGL